MAEKQKVRIFFEFDRRDYDNVVFFIDTNIKDREDIEKVWNAMTSEEIILQKDSFALLGLSQRDMMALFVSIAIVWVEEKVKSK